jgi:hypothetical protein
VSVPHPDGTGVRSRPRGHRGALPVAGVPMDLVHPGGLELINERAHLLAEGVVDHQAHRTGVGQAVGNLRAAVEGIGGVGLQAAGTRLPCSAAGLAASSRSDRTRARRPPESAPAPAACRG